MQPYAPWWWAGFKWEWCTGWKWLLAQVQGLESRVNLSLSSSVRELFSIQFKVFPYVNVSVHKEKQFSVLVDYFSQRTTSVIVFIK